MGAPSQLRSIFFIAIVFVLLVILIIMIRSREVANFIPDINPSLTNKDPEAMVDWGYSGEKVPTGFGYVLATHYSDQLTSGGWNVVSLQCWARAISKHLKVVEPFVVGSIFGLNLSGGEPMDMKQEVRIRDIYSMENWEEQLKGDHFSSFENWETFLKSAPRNLITVGKQCEYENCDDKFRSDVLLFAKKHKLNMTRYVHLKNEFHTFDEFRDIIYGDHKPEQSVVIFRRWGGISNQLSVYRISLSDSNNLKCSGIGGNFSIFKTSSKIIEDSSRYWNQYMSKVKGTGYISVMLRAERFVIRHKFRAIKSEDIKLSLFKKCVDSIVNQVHNFQKLYNTSGVFLTADSRKSGSDGLRDRHNNGMIDNVVETPPKVWTWIILGRMGCFF